MIGDTNDRIDKTNTNVDNLSKRVDKLEDMLKNKPAVAAAGKDDCDNKATKPVVKKSSKAVVKKKRSSNVSSHSRYNSVEILMKMLQEVIGKHMLLLRKHQQQVLV